MHSTWETPLPRENQDGRPDDGALSRIRGCAVRGELLRSLRYGRRWSQLVAAERAGVSDRFIRKAERGGPIERNSIDLLAQLYSTPERILTVDDLIDSPLQLRGGVADFHHNEMFLRRWFDEVWNKERLDAIDELASPDCVLHVDGVELHGPAAIRRRAEAIRNSFSNFDVQIEHVTTHRDLVIARLQIAMTNTGTWMGMAPTNSRIITHGSTWMRIHNGRLSERWDYWYIGSSPRRTAAQVGAAQRCGTRRKRRCA